MPLDHDPIAHDSFLLLKTKLDTAFSRATARAAAYDRRHPEARHAASAELDRAIVSCLVSRRMTEYEVFRAELQGRPRYRPVKILRTVTRPKGIDPLPAGPGVLGGLL